MQTNIHSLSVYLFAFITYLLVLASTSFAQEREEMPTSFPGIDVISPAQQATVAPGETIPVNINIDKSLDPGFVFIMSKMSTGISDLELKQKPFQDSLQTHFQGSLQIPNDLAGPQELWVLVKNTADKIIGGLAIKLNVVPTEIPVEIEAHGKSYELDIPPDSFEGSRKVYVKGEYANGAQRDISAAITGTQYKSTNPQVFTFSDKGVLNPVGPGTAYLVVEHRGLRTFVLVEVTAQGQKGVPPIDQTTKVKMTQSVPRRLPGTDRYEVKVTIRNDAELPLSLPLYLVITGLDKEIEVVDSDVTKQVHPVGSPAVFIETDERDYLPLGAYAEATITFRNYARKNMDYQLKLYSGVDI